MPVDIGFVTGVVVIGIILIGVIGNVLTLFVIIRYEPLRDVTGMFLANLAVADLLQSVIGMPLMATSSFRDQWIFGETLCTISGLTNSLFCIASVLTLTAVAVDRYLAIVYPLKYRAWLTVERARMVLAYIWLHALFVAFLPVVGWSRYVYLPYEFICTVQFEYDKAFMVFVTVTCFGTRNSTDRDNRVLHKCHENRMSPGPCETSDADWQVQCIGAKSPCYPGYSESHRDKSELREASFSQGKLEQTVAKLTEGNNSAIQLQGPSKIVKIFDEKTDPARCVFVPGNPGTSGTGQDQTSHMQTERINERKRKPSVRPSGSTGMTHLNPVVTVVSPGSSKIPNGKGKLPAGASINPSGRFGKSRVSSAAVVSPEINRWTEEVSQGREQKVIKEEGKNPAGTSINPSGTIRESCVSPAAGFSPTVHRWTEEISQRRELEVIKEEEESSPSQKRTGRLPGHLA
ncbi:hypothetical protein ACROYT_G029540 [Oculina patagonica]